MNYKSSLLAIVIIMTITPCVSAQKIAPVTPDASTETKALLEYLQSLSGKHTLSGQHNFPISRDKNTQFAASYIGKTPIVWSQDFGFAKDGDKDSYLARPSVIEEAIRQHKSGAIVTLCWHAVPPTAEEPITFQPLPGYDNTRDKIV
jgi:mannan endo-1,4-beta-mannosidase